MEALTQVTNPQSLGCCSIFLNLVLQPRQMQLQLCLTFDRPSTNRHFSFTIVKNFQHLRMTGIISNLHHISRASVLPFSSTLPNPLDRKQTKVASHARHINFPSSRLERDASDNTLRFGICSKGITLKYKPSIKY